MYFYIYTHIYCSQVLNCNKNDTEIFPRKRHCFVTILPFICILYSLSIVYCHSWFEGPGD